MKNNKKGIIGITFIVVATTLVVIIGLFLWWYKYKAVIDVGLHNKGKFCVQGYLSNGENTFIGERKYIEWKKYILDGSNAVVRGRIEKVKSCYCTPNERKRTDENIEKFEEFKKENKDADLIKMDVENVIKTGVSVYREKVTDNIRNKYNISFKEYEIIVRYVYAEKKIERYQRIFNELNLSCDN